ncbi:MAG: hypothetical protein Q6J33_04965, partial [Gloeomargarita sp. DG_2_bins_126]
LSELSSPTRSVHFFSHSSVLAAMPRTKPPSDRVLTIRLPNEELVKLENYCAAKGRTKTDVLRELIRKLRNN